MSIVYTIDQENNSAYFILYANNVETSSFVVDTQNSLVSASAILLDVVIPFAEHKSNIHTVKQFIRQVEDLVPINKTKPNRYRQNYVKRPQEAEANLRVLDYPWDVEYQRNTQEVTLKARASNIFTWEGFVYFINFHETFVFQVELGWS